MANPVIVRGNLSSKQCAFTFDDGPWSLDLEAWLEALEDNGIIGTFFFTGEWLDRFPNKAREVLNRGHELAPHTYHHRAMAQVSREIFFEELKLTELAYQEATGRPCPLYFRFPYRSYREENLDWLAEWGYVDVEGDSSDDWAGISAEAIVANIEPTLDSGSIIVHHANDIAKETPKALHTLAHMVKEKGLAAVGVSELLRSLGKEQGTRSWKVKVELPAQDELAMGNWISLHTNDERRKLAAELSEWETVKAIGGLGQPKWLHELANGDNQRIVAGRHMADQYWTYAYAEVRGKELVLVDFATKEPVGDALVYLLRWAISTALELGCERVIATRDMRRIDNMCRQMGWSSEIVPDIH
jgi:peptidoglycan/xylan/chitin deacetylase (PgdA/CDA1 family)